MNHNSTNKFSQLISFVQSGNRTEAKNRVLENWMIHAAMTAKVPFQEKNLSVE